MKKLTNNQKPFLKSKMSMSKNNLVPSLFHPSPEKLKGISVHSKNMKENFITNSKTIKNQVLLNKKQKFDSFEKREKHSNPSLVPKKRQKYAVISNKVREKFIKLISTKKVTIKEVFLLEKSNFFILFFLKKRLLKNFL